jgi:hypothetical protein
MERGCNVLETRCSGEEGDVPRLPEELHIRGDEDPTLPIGIL